MSPPGVLYNIHSQICAKEEDQVTYCNYIVYRILKDEDVTI
jgi:hypothetical protein